MLSARVDSTPSGLSLLLSVDPLHHYDDSTTLFLDSRRWIAAVTESHLAYPVLTYFRSTREGDSWVSPLAAAMEPQGCDMLCRGRIQHGSLANVDCRSPLVDAFVRYFDLHAHSDGAYRSASAELITTALGGAATA